MKRVLVFSGSTRSASFNKKLAVAGSEAIDAAGASATLIDLADYPAPIYNGDEEEAKGFPSTMWDFRSRIAEHDAIMIATPEYNGSVPPLLVNILNWASRPVGDEPPCAVFIGKPVALMAATPGDLGGVRVIPRLRDFLAELGAVTVPGFVTVPSAFEAFNNDGKLTAKQPKKMLERLAERLVASAQ